MSSYSDFSKCVICRSKKNLVNYQGDFEVTMMLNSLYLSLMYILEKRRELYFKTTKMIPFLKENNIVNDYNNCFTSEDIARCLRNALAHFNVEIANDPYGKRIETIRLWSKNLPTKECCKEPCASPKCIPIQYNANTTGSICTFVFSVSQA